MFHVSTKREENDKELRTVNNISSLIFRVIFNSTLLLFVIKYIVIYILYSKNEKKNTLVLAHYFLIKGWRSNHITI